MNSGADLQCTDGTLHVASGAREGNGLATSCRCTGVNAVLDAGGGDRFHVPSTVVHSTLNQKVRTIGAGVGRHVRCWANNRRVNGLCIVHAQAVAATTVLGRVAGTRGDTITKNTADGSAIRSQRVATITLLCILQTGVMVASAFAVAQAGLNGHRVGAEGAAVEGTSGGVTSATQIIPTSHIRGVGLGCSDSRLGTAGITVGSLIWTPSDRITSGKSIQNSSDWLVHFRGNDARLTFSRCEQITKNITVRQETAIVSASVSSILKNINVPAVDKVSVKSVSSRIS